MIRNLIVLICVLGTSLPTSGVFAADGKAEVSWKSSCQRFQKVLGPKEIVFWEQRLKELNHDIGTRGILSVSGFEGRLLTGYAYQEFYDWDLYFENLYLSYYGISEFCFSNFKAFLAKQQPNGFIPRSFGLKNWGARQMFKPFLAQIAVLGSKQRGDDYEWLRTSAYGQLRRYIDTWFLFDRDGNGLPVWDSSDGSGMDNQFSRVGKRFSYRAEGVDLACELYRELRAMALIASRLGKADEAKEWNWRAEKLAALVNSVLWDEEDGFYYDRDELTGQRIKVKSVSGFFPLWVGIASPLQAKRLVEAHLLNPKEFWTPYPVATYALTEPDFYQGTKRGECNWKGTAWIPTNYMILHGLMDYGYRKEAGELAYKTFAMALDKNSVTREYYDSDTGRGNGMNPFWGWSSLAYVMPMEWESGYDPMRLTEPVLPLLKNLLKPEIGSPLTSTNP